MIIGQPKTFAEVPDFTEEDLSKLYVQMEEALTSGTPMEVPAAMPMGQLITFAAMLQKRGKRIAELEGRVRELEKPGGDTASGLPVVGGSQIDFSALGDFAKPADKPSEEAS